MRNNNHNNHRAAFQARPAQKRPKHSPASGLNQSNQTGHPTPALHTQVLRCTLSAYLLVGLNGGDVENLLSEPGGGDGLPHTPQTGLARRMGEVSHEDDECEECCCEELDDEEKLD